jgi:hypothetical protein
VPEDYNISRGFLMGLKTQEGDFLENGYNDLDEI